MPTVDRKILAVIYVSLRKYGKKPRFLIVKDATEKEWTFISGTCEDRERTNKCAVREIKEETRGLVSLKALPKRTKTFQTMYENKRVDVMFIPIRLTEEQMKQMEIDFPNIETRGIPELEENTDLRFETFGQFMKRKHVWDFVKNLYTTETFIEMCPK
jgi:8-oxo-dGTP pyrophosphatase MutT (NUDIX family)